jgi:hypothetical protein
LAVDDPHEGFPEPIRFPHRVWKSIEEVPDNLRKQILTIYSQDRGGTPETAFRTWFMSEEQSCLMRQFGLRQYYMSCWHAASHESVAMWKIYASPGAGVAIVSNGGRLEAALASNPEPLNLGAVRYQDPNTFEIGTPNPFDTLMVKRSSYSYEKEVRLVHWDTTDIHDPLNNFSWNEATMRFDNVVEDRRPLIPGLSLQCDVDVLVDRVIVSPLAPSWYLPMIERLKQQLGFRFPIVASRLLIAPDAIP